MPYGIMLGRRTVRGRLSGGHCSRPACPLVDGEQLFSLVSLVCLGFYFSLFVNYSFVTILNYYFLFYFNY